MHAVFIRAPWIEEAGEGVDVLGRVVGGAADGRIVAARQGNLVATSFHPELTGDHRVHALFVDIVRSSTGERDTTHRDTMHRDTMHSAAGDERGTS
jgi:5'-phosphate synthase pdxT subunit